MHECGLHKRPLGLPLLGNGQSQGVCRHLKQFPQGSPKVAVVQLHLVTTACVQPTRVMSSVNTEHGSD